MNALLMRRMPIQNVTSKIHFPVQKCLRKQGTTNTNIINEQKCPQHLPKLHNIYIAVTDPAQLGIFVVK